MKISDFIEEVQEVEESSILDLNEVEKTAELLEALSEEDTFEDDLAKLAVLEDMALANELHMEKDAGISAYFDDAARFAKKKSLLRTAGRGLKQEKILLEVAQTEKQTLRVKQQIANMSKSPTDRSKVLDVVGPLAGGVVAGGVGMKILNDKKNKEMINEISNYYGAKSKNI